MSPECGWSEVPRELRKSVKDYLGCKDLARLLNSENGFFIDENIKLIDANNLTQEVLEKKSRYARISSAYYHVVSLKNTPCAKNARESQAEKYADVTLEDAEWIKSRGRHHRGKHRSETGGKGLRAWFRSSKYVKWR